MKAHECKDFDCVSKLPNEYNCQYKKCDGCYSSEFCFWCNRFDSCLDARKNLKEQLEES